MQDISTAKQRVESLSKQIPNLIADEPLSRHSTIRVGGLATAFVVVRSVEELTHAILVARKEGVNYHILGGGSNTLFSDQGYDGLVIKNMANSITVAGKTEQVTADLSDMTVGETRHEAAHGAKYITFTDLDYEEKPGDTLVKAESGVNLTALIVKTLGMNLTGLQWFGGIPGVVGGAVYNNIHGGTHFIAERLVSVDYLSEAGELMTLKKEELEFGYDSSRFHRTKEVITSALFLLTESTAPETERAERAFREWVRRKSQMQPKQGSMGSTFQNISQAVREQIKAPTTAAGWLIDQVGLKGYQIGQAQIANEHANFILNLGGATADDVYRLMVKAQREVKKQFGVTLVPEVFLVGDFSSVAEQLLV